MVTLRQKVCSKKTNLQPICLTVQKTGLRNVIRTQEGIRIVCSVMFLTDKVRAQCSPSVKKVVEAWVPEVALMVEKTSFWGFRIRSERVPLTVYSAELF